MCPKYVSGFFCNIARAAECNVVNICQGYIRPFIWQTYVMFCAIWYQLYNLKNVKNTHEGTLLIELATLLKVTLLHGCFSLF